MHTFSSLDTLFSTESYVTRQNLDHRIKNFWVSKDFAVAGDAILHPGDINTVKIRLDKGLLPDVGFSLGMFKHLEITMRSCFA